MDNQTKIYMDHSATTPVDEDVFLAMMPYFTEKFGNPASIHTIGQEGIIAVDEARDQVADFLYCMTNEIVFTSGATESNNLAIKGVVEASEVAMPHIITSKIEHPAVLETCKYMESIGVDVTYIGVDKDGIIKMSELEEAINENTILITVMYANNETGSIQPIKKIGKLVAKLNEDRDNRILFHTDAVQAIQYMDCNVENLGVDLLSLSAHKFYGPKGIGVLYVKDGIKIVKTQHGGHQEYNKRAGTSNVPSIVGLGKAIELAGKNRDKGREHVLGLKMKLAEELLKISDSHVNGNLEKGLPNIINICFGKIEGESILLSLDFEGIAVSTGSACTSGTLEPSHVLISMGVAKEQAHGSIRFSLGKGNTKTDIEKVIKVMPGIVAKLRKMSPIK